MTAIKFDIIFQIFSTFNSRLISTGQSGFPIMTGRKYRGRLPVTRVRCVGLNLAVCRAASLTGTLPGRAGQCPRWCKSEATPFF
jgi:hypothetical protein